METVTKTLTPSIAKSTDLSASDSFIKVLQKCCNEGEVSSPRGQEVRELFLETVEINPLFPCPDFENRPFNWKYFAGELGWYLTGVRGIRYINKFSSFWKNLTDENGNINSNYGNLLFYSNQLIWAYESLIRDKDTRQAISFVSLPQFQYEGNKDFVCTLYLNFWIRQDKLYMKVQMRSNDIFYGFTYDVPFFATVMQTMWHNLKNTYPELVLGTYYHSADNIHYYERHFDIGNEILKEGGKNQEFCFLREPLFWIKPDHLVLTQNTLDFKEKMEKLIEEENLSNESCKEALGGLFIIQ